MPATAGIRVTDSVRHTVEKRYPGDDNAWIPAGVYPEYAEGPE